MSDLGWGKEGNTQVTDRNVEHGTLVVVTSQGGVHGYTQVGHDLFSCQERKPFKFKSCIKAFWITWSDSI